MKTTKIAIMAMILLSFVSCQKDEDIRKDSDRLVQSKDRGSDDEIIVIGHTQLKGVQLIKVFSMDLDKYLETVPVQEDGSFTTAVTAGPYIFELFENGAFIGASEVLVIDKENTHVELSF